jgi:hypothetical protein
MNHPYLMCFFRPGACPGKSQADVDTVSDVGGGGTFRNQLAGALLFDVGSLPLLIAM